MRLLCMTDKVLSLTLDGKMFYFKSAVTVRHLFEVILKEINVRKG
jgi:hypothetical protein